VIAMSWVVWRQYRAAAAITAALVAAFAALIVVTGIQVASQWHSALAVCTASHTCGTLPGTLFLGSHAVGFLVIMTLGVPAVLGMLAGAPLLAQEFETGTSQYAWTQGVTRRRWLAVKTGWLLLAAAAVGGLVSALVTWWSGPNNALQANAARDRRHRGRLHRRPDRVLRTALALHDRCNQLLPGRRRTRHRRGRVAARWGVRRR
jgi:hypothetical protein